jgi:hypothetical protein
VLKAALDFEKIAEGFSKEAVKIPGFLSHVNVGNQKIKAMRGYMQSATEAGPESFLAALPLMGAEKVFGKKNVRNFKWKYLNQPALAADTALGRLAGKVPGMKKMFTQKEQIPWGKNLHRTVERPSATAPLVKARNIAVPIVAGIGLEKGVRSISEKPKDKTSNQDQKGATMNTDNINKLASAIQPELREKVASTMLRLHADNKEHEKRAQATKFLYKQAELGYAPIPNTYHEYEQKLASLMSQDMAVLEKALELTAGNEKIGELSGSDFTSRDAASTFQSDVLGF